MQLRNLWAVDGLYFLGIEELYGTEVATEIDANVWEVMGKIEARKLKEFLGITRYRYSFDDEGIAVHHLGT